MKPETNKFLAFFLLNACLVTMFFCIQLSDFYGRGEGIPYGLVLIADLIAIPIIVIQYFILRSFNHWLPLLITLYLGMVVFLFLWGVYLNWGGSSGGYDPGTWMARFDAGLKLSLLSQFFSGALLALAVIYACNFALRNRLFR